MKKYSWMRRAALTTLTAAALMMVVTGSALAEGGASAKEEIGPGVGAGYEELQRKAEELAAEKAKANEKKEIGPGFSAAAEETVTEESTAAEAETTGRTIDPTKPMVALTIDDGPYAPVGNRIMDCLAAYDAKATFFVVGNRCASYTEEMQRMINEGHEIGNHTYSHKYLNKLGAESIRSEIQRGVDAIQTTSGSAPATLRLPGGNKNKTVMDNVHVPIIGWSIDTLDWKTKDAQSTVNAVLNHVQDGDIILIHELYSATADAVEQLVPVLVERGYQLVTVSELAAQRGGMENGKIYYSFRPQQ